MKRNLTIFALAILLMSSLTLAGPGRGKSEAPGQNMGPTIVEVALGINGGSSLNDLDPNGEFYLLIEAIKAADPEVARTRNPVHWHFEQRPARLDADPAFDVMRRLDPRELPPSLGQFFGAKEQWLVLPTDAEPAALEAWRDLARHWQRRFGNVVVKSDRDDLTPSADTPMWLMGWNNRLLAGDGPLLSGAGQVLEPQGARIGDRLYRRGSQAVVLLNPGPQPRRLGFIGAASPEAIRALAGKLTHYGGYGRLVFGDPDAGNLVKDRLPAGNSPLTRHFMDEHVPLVLPHRPALTESPFRH